MAQICQNLQTITGSGGTIMTAQVISFTPDSPDGAIPPQNIESEEAILGGILLDSASLERIIDILKPEDFYVNAHRLIYVSCLDLHRKNQPCDLMQVTNDLSDRGQLGAIGGKSKLTQLLDRTVTSINIDSLAQIVAQKATSRRLISVGSEIQRLGWDQTEDLELRLDTAEQKVFALRSERSGSATKKIKPLANLSTELYQEFEEAGRNGTTAVTTGFYDLDSLLGGGFNPGDLIVIGGRPSMGKSLLGFLLAYEVAAMHQKPTLIFSLEMDAHSVGRRFYSNLTGIEYSRLRQGTVSLSEWEEVSAAMNTLCQTPVFIDDSPKDSVIEIKSLIRSTIATHKGLNLVVIDYLQRMVTGSEVNLATKIGEVTNQLKSIALECKVPIVLLSQLNRKVEERNDKRPKQSDLRDSGRIEEDADVILFPYRDEYYNPDTPDRGLMEIICTKQRNGATGSIKLLCDTTFSRLQNYAGK